jgi:homoisocitrate dehydrogenase
VSLQLCVIPGDGIGPEVTTAAVRVLQHALPELEIVNADAGWGVFQATGESTPAETLEALTACNAGIFGAVSSPAHNVAGYRSAILQIRQQLDLFANIRPIDSRWKTHGDGLPNEVHLVIVRENTEDLYVGREMSDGQTAVAQRLITRSASRRIAETACRIAREMGHRRITIVHKANVLPVTDGLFRDSVVDVIRESSDLEFDELLVDIAAYRLVQAPERFQTIVTTNMFGDILSDLAAYWCGGMGRAPSLNLGEGIALAEPVHGSAPDIAGRGIADPTAAILSAAMLCRFHWNRPAVALRIETALLSAIRLLPDSEVPFSTPHFTDLVIREIEAAVPIIPGL